MNAHRHDRPVALAACLLLAFTGAASAESLLVTSPADDGSPGTLRWAIERNNANPGNHRIEIGRADAAPLVIMPASLLPAIKGPVTITAPGRLSPRPDSGVAGDLLVSPGAIIDGSKLVDVSTTRSCPSEDGKGHGPNVRSLQKPALAVVDSGGVEISGLEIRNFCIGVLLLRSRGNRVHHTVIHDMVGAAGILITGDAGDAAGSSTQGKSLDNTVEHNVVYDTGDGAECTRGSARITFRNNLFYQSRPDTASPRSQGVECANTGNDDIRFLGNVFRNYSDGLQLNRATNVLVEGNTITGSTYGITTMASAVIRNNTITGNRMGIGPAATARATITRNRIYDNGKPILALPTSAGGTTDPNSPALLGIDIGTDGPTANDDGARCADQLPDCDTVQNHPVLSAESTWGADGELALRGSLASRPGATFLIEFYANHAPNAAGHAEGEAYLGTVEAKTDATGHAGFAWTLPRADPLGSGSARALFTATATSASGRTSEFSPGLALARAVGPAAERK